MKRIVAIAIALVFVMSQSAVLARPGGGGGGRPAPSRGGGYNRSAPSRPSGGYDLSRDVGSSGTPVARPPSSTAATGNRNTANRNTGNRNTNVRNSGNTRNTTINANRTVVSNPVYGGGGAYGWNGGVAWYPAPAYYGGGFWGAFAIGATTAAVFGTVVNSSTHTTYTSYEVQPSSPGSTLLSNYGLTQTQCGGQNLVVIYGPNNSVICANPNGKVAAGEYDLDSQTLSLVSR